MKSNCCDAEMKVYTDKPHPELNDGAKGATSFHVCTKCNMACDPSPANPDNPVPPVRTTDEAGNPMEEK